LLFFLLAGRTLDHMMRERARSAVRNLVRLSPRGAMVINPTAGREYLALDEIEPGMHLAIAPGDRIPVDGRVISGRSDMDFAVVNGESAPQLVEAGFAGASGNAQSDRTAGAGSQPQREDLVPGRNGVDDGGGRKRPRRLSPDRRPGLVDLRAGGAFAGAWNLYRLDGGVGRLAHVAMMTAVAVLIITCPCALGLAVPVVQVVAAGRLFENGIMVKDGSAMERLAETDRVVFDKTGTLTRGRRS
jgi:Cu2+-exporting ATPase